MTGHYIPNRFPWFGFGRGKREERKRRQMGQGRWNCRREDEMRRIVGLSTEGLKNFGSSLVVSRFNCLRLIMKLY